METTLDGRRVHWREAGNGENALVLLHAFPLHSGMWEPQLAAVPTGWRFLAPDLPGFGRSDAMTGEDSLEMDGFAESVAALMDHVEIPAAVVCGLSMGGYTAFALWRRHPERVRALVLCDTRAGADTDEGRAGRYALAERVRREGTGAAVEAMLPRLLSEETHRRRPDVVQRARALMLEAPPEAVSRALHGMATRRDSTGLLPGINVPTLVLVGDDDVTTPPAEAERIAACIPGARLVRIRAAGHLTNLETPAEFNRALIRFLTDLP